MSRITEETPLLPDSTADGSGSLGDEPDTDAVERHQRRCTRAIFILTWHSVLLAVFLLVSNAIMVAIYYARTGELAPWERQLALAGLMCTVCFDATHTATPCRNDRPLTIKTAPGDWTDLLL